MIAPLIIIESPYIGKSTNELVRNRNYLKECILDSISRGEAPFAGHGFYTQYLNDRDPRSRALGMRLSRTFLYKAALVAVYLDYGWTPGMRVGVDLARRHAVPVEERRING